MGCLCENNNDQPLGPIGATGPVGETGPSGVSVVGTAIDSNNHLIIYWSDNTTTDTGELPQAPQGAPGKSSIEASLTTSTTPYKYLSSRDSSEVVGVIIFPGSNLFGSPSKLSVAYQSDSSPATARLKDPDTGLVMASVSLPTSSSTTTTTITNFSNVPSGPTPMEIEITRGSGEIQTTIKIMAISLS